MNPIAIERVQALGFCGVLLVFFGCFAPLFHLPIIGSISFVGNGEGDGIFVIALAIVAAVLLCVRAYRWVAAPAAGATLISLLALFNFLAAVSQMRGQLAGVAKENLFAGLATAFADSISLEWGWVFLLLGLLCLFAVVAAGWLAPATPAPPPFAQAVPPPSFSATPPAAAPQHRPAQYPRAPAPRASFGQRRH
jgi:hypothetical protein